MRLPRSVLILLIALVIGLACRPVGAAAQPLTVVHHFPILVTHGTDDHQIPVRSAHDIRQALKPMGVAAASNLIRSSRLRILVQLRTASFTW